MRYCRLQIVEIIRFRRPPKFLSLQQAIKSRHPYENDGPTNLEQPPPNHVQSDTAASGALAGPPHALQETSPRSGLAMEESEHDVGSLEQLELYADEHYLAVKLALEDHLGKVGSKNVINITLAR
ncbi:hypothetical protein AVEN_14431-1 [Araneus ventricosus]|uniref:Uncharacterized protein n=1 Tax=Araneus ventricosus TaxID=182803 RepID=A0A4Y2SZ10_ARAVE|nr:hypothetical protein AVEN_14431-1 [Araneus ventricosus]